MLQDSLLKLVFKEDYKKNVKRLKSDEEIRPLLVSIIKYKIKAVDQVSIEDSTWPLKRAYADGRLSELNRILKILEM